MSIFKPRASEGNFLFSVILMTAKMLFVTILILGITGAGALMGVAKAWVETAPQLDVSAFAQQNKTSFIYDRNGALITDFKGSENRVDATWDELSDNLKNAIIAVEDQRFYTHNGVDIKRIVGALIGNLLTNSMEGGSTITCQLVKLTMLTPDQNYKRKLQEAYLALQLENVVSKERVLLEYMNIVYLGGSNYGVKVAAADYFDKEISELTLRECAALASVIRNPYKYNPRENYGSRNTPEVIEDRTDHVLGLMHYQGLITQEEYDHALTERLSVLPSSPFISRMYDNAYYVEYAIYDVVTKMLRMEKVEDNPTNRSAMENRLRTGGFRIYTCLDPIVQKTVQDIVTNWNNYPAMRSSADQSYQTKVAEGVYRKVVEPQAAAAVIDQRTGELITVIGGRAEPNAMKQLNRAFQAPMPIGSSIKPIAVYGPAFDLGNSPGSPVINAPLKIEGWDTPKGYPSNFSGSSFTGVETLRRAMVKSNNTSAAQALFGYVGIENSYNYLLKLGIDKSHIEATGAGLALGASRPTMIELAAAFAAIANEGQYLEPYAFTKVLNADGSLYMDVRQQQVRRQVFKKSTAWMLVSVMRQCVGNEGTAGNRAQFGGYTVAGKTGTHSDFRGVSFAGMTGYYTGAVWIGSDKFNALVSNATGGTYAAPLWTAIMRSIHTMKGASGNRAILPGSAEDYKLVRAQACAISGMKPTKACIEDVNGYGITEDYYLAGTQPTESCNMHRTIKLCTRSRKAPTENCKTVKAYGTVYLPEGHPLRFPAYSTVARYFPGASTDKASASIGVCTTCAKAAPTKQNLEQLASATNTANGLIQRATDLLDSGVLGNKQYDKLEDLRDKTQRAIDAQSLKNIKNYGKQLQQLLKKVR